MNLDILFKTKKIQTQTMQHFYLVYQAKKFLKQAEDNIELNLPNCAAPISTAEEKQNITWWLGHACREGDDDVEYYYVIEDAGVDACARIDQQTAAHYYRLILRADYLSAASMPVLLLASRVQTAPVAEQCHSQLHFVKIGWQTIVEI